MTRTKADPVGAILASIEAAGGAVDPAVGASWLEAVAAAAATPGEFAIALEAGLGGHELALIDFDPTAVDRLRRLGGLIAVPALPSISSALAIAGSAAQGRVHPFPADADFFERVHIAAPTESDARRRLAELVRANALQVDTLPGFSLEEILFGTVADQAALRWTPAEVAAGTLTLPGAARTVTWEEAAADPGFVKLDWLLTDPAAGGPGWVSKVIDATWQTPAGQILSLDGTIDPDYQQVYLDAAGAQLAARLTRAHEERDRAEYVRQLELEVHRYSLADPPNFGKVARRLYNLCRLTGRYAEALFLRGLFAGPPARLYQARTRLELIAARTPHDPAGARADLASLLDDLAEVLAADPACHRAAGASRDALTAPSAAALLAAISQLDTALAASASQAFSLGLHAYPPIADLLATLGVRR